MWSLFADVICSIFSGSHLLWSLKHQGNIAPKQGIESLGHFNWSKDVKEVSLYQGLLDSLGDKKKIRTEGLNIWQLQAKTSITRTKKKCIIWRQKFLHPEQQQQHWTTLSMNESHFILVLWLVQIVFYSFIALDTQCLTLCKSVCLICYPFTSCSSGRLALWSPWRCPARPVTVVLAHCLDNEVVLSHLFSLHSSSLLIEWKARGL